MNRMAVLGRRMGAALGVVIVAACGLAQTPAQLVQQAIQDRDSVASARLSLLSAERMAAALGAYPGLRLETGFASSPDVGGGEDLTLYQPIDLFGRWRVSRSLGGATVSQARAGLRQEELAVQQEVLTAYSNWSNAVRFMQTASALVDVARRIEKAASDRVQAQALPEIQLERASLEVQKHEQALVDRQAALKASEALLAQALGADKVDPSLLAQAVSLPELPESKPERLRPELASLAAEQRTAQLEAQSARLSRLPDLEVQARRAPWSSGAEQYGVRLQLAAPLWDHGAARSAQRAAAAKAESAHKAYSGQLKRIQAEIQAARVQSDAALESLNSYRRLQEGARKLLDRTTRAFELGAATLLDVLDAQRTLYEAKDQLSTAQLNADLAATSLLSAEGVVLGEKE